MTDEQWVWIPGWEGSYRISNHGRVHSVHRVIVRSDGRKLTVKPRIRRATTHRNGRQAVILARHGKYTRIWPHLLVPQLFSTNNRKKVTTP